MLLIGIKYSSPVCEIIHKTISIIITININHTYSIDDIQHMIYYIDNLQKAKFIFASNWLCSINVQINTTFQYTEYEFLFANKLQIIDFSWKIYCKLLGTYHLPCTYIKHKIYNVPTAHVYYIYLLYICTYLIIQIVYISIIFKRLQNQTEFFIIWYILGKYTLKFRHHFWKLLTLHIINNSITYEYIQYQRYILD